MQCKQTKKTNGSEDRIPVRGPLSDPPRSFNSKRPVLHMYKTQNFHPKQIFSLSVSYSKILLQASSLYKHLNYPSHSYFKIKDPLNSRTTEEREGYYPENPRLPRNNQTPPQTALQAQIPTPKNTSMPEKPSYFQIPTRLFSNQITFKT